MTIENTRVNKVLTIPTEKIPKYVVRKITLPTKKMSILDILDP
jgi:hypothetical protein